MDRDEVWRDGKLVSIIEREEDVQTGLRKTRDVLAGTPPRTVAIPQDELRELRLRAALARLQRADLQKVPEPFRGLLQDMLLVLTRG